MRATTPKPAAGDPESDLHSPQIKKMSLGVILRIHRCGHSRRLVEGHTGEGGIVKKEELGHRFILRCGGHGGMVIFLGGVVGKGV